MIQRLAIVALIAACCSASAHAQVGDLSWQIDVDGTLSLINQTGAAIAFDGYTLACEAGCLDPDGWRTIPEAIAEDSAAVIAGLGIGALSMGPAGTPSGHQLSELNLAGAATLQPGASWSFGRPINGTLSEIRDWAANGCLTSAISGNGDVAYLPVVEFLGGGGGAECIPEPSSAYLALLAVAGLLAAGARRGASAKA